MNQETSYESVTVHGQTLESLSNQLPTDVIALNELIKNAYDADATEVSINYDSIAEVLTIVDNGMGIPRDGVQKLFAIGKSEKQYGKSFCSQEKGETRYIQGAKGLGFLAVLRFAENVEWDTRTEKEVFKFKCRGSEMLQMDNVTDYKVPVTPSRKKSRGTTITMELRPDSRESLDELFEDSAKVAKLANAFRATNIKIKLVKDGIDIPTKKVDSFYKECEQRRLFYIAISSKDTIATIYHDGKEIDNVSFGNLLPDECSIEGELLIFSLQTGDSRGISPLYKKSSDGTTLSPLVYINHSLFDNETLFNPEILRKQQSRKSLPQMIGYVDVISESQDLKFNPDRTKLVENAYSKAIQNALSFINKEVQISGSKYKAENKSDLKYGDPKPEATALKKGARIILHPIPDIYTGENEINLKNYVCKVYNEKGEIEDSDSIEVYIDEEHLEEGILPSQTEPKVLKIRFALANGVEKEVCVNVKSRKIVEKKPSFIPFKFTAVENTHMKICAIILNRLDSLYKMQGKRERKFIFVIACALRSVFELSIKSLRNQTYMPTELSGEMTVEQGIKAVFDYIQSEDRQKKTDVQLLVKRFQIDYHSIRNLKTESFITEYLNSHLGVHNATLYYSAADVSDIATKASTFAYIVNELHKVKSGRKK